VPIIDIVARELRIRCKMLAVHAAWHRLGFPEGLLSAKERAHGIHGGDAETSLMLAFRPKTVHMEHAINFESAAVSIEQEYKQLRVTQPIGLGWMASDLHELGAAGDASNATAEKGEALAESGAEKFVDLLRDVLAFDLSRLRPGPLARK
jgi:creatinine amidohydrolase